MVPTQQNGVLSKERGRELQHVFLIMYSSTLKLELRSVGMYSTREKDYVSGLHQECKDFLMQTNGHFYNSFKIIYIIFCHKICAHIKTGGLATNFSYVIFNLLVASHTLHCSHSEHFANMKLSCTDVKTLPQCEHISVNCFGKLRGLESLAKCKNIFPLGKKMIRINNCFVMMEKGVFSEGEIFGAQISVWDWLHTLKTWGGNLAHGFKGLQWA